MTLLKRLILATFAFSLASCATETRNLTTSEIEEKMLDHQSEFRSCYDSTAEKRSGQLVTRFTISDSGAVSHARAESNELKSPELERCILSRIQAIRFPRSSPGTTREVVYPFRFQAK